MTWNIWNIIRLSAFIAYALLLSIVIWRNPKTKPAQIFILYLFSMVIWSLGSFLMHAEPPLGTPLFWNKILVAGALGMPVLFYSFVRSFLEIRGQKIWLYLGVVFYISVFIANVMGYFAKEIYVSEGFSHFKIGLAAPFAGIGWFLFIGLAAFNLVQGYRKTKDSLYRNKLKYLLIGVLAISAGLTTNFTKWQGYPLDVSLNIINALLITYVILKYKLLDINIVIRKGFVYFTLTAIIAGGYLFMIFILERLLRGVVGISLIALLIAIGIALAFQPLRDYLQQWVDRLFFRERFDYYQILRKFAQEMVTILDLDDLANSTVDTISKTMQTDKVAILLGNKEGFYLKTSRGLDKSFISSLKLKKDNSLFSYMIEKRKILSRNEINIIPEVKALWESEAKELEMLKAELFIPLITKNDLIGIIILGKKLSEDSYSEEECALLSAVASEASVAFENAILIKDIKQAEIKLQNWSEELEQKVKERTRELSQTQTQLFQTSKLATLGEMSTGLAHELNQPLAGISLAAMSTRKLMERGLLTEEEIKDTIEDIDTNIRRMSNIITHIRTFARQDTLEFRQMQVNKSVENALELLSEQLRLHEIEVIKELSPDLPQIMGEPYQIEQVMINLISNARDALDEKEKWDSERLKGWSKKLKIRTSLKENWVCIDISDNGVGMSAGEKGKIFEPFYTTKEVGKATGLGMSISYGIIQNHKGKIDVKSEERKGTRVSVKLPIKYEKQNINHR